MNDKRGKRPLLKLRLSHKPDARVADKIVDNWRKDRCAAQNVTDAIRLYDALQAGNVAMLYEMFPVMAKANFGDAASSQLRRKPPAAQPTNRKRTVKTVEPDEDKAIDDMLDLF